MFLLALSLSLLRVSHSTYINLLGNNTCQSVRYCTTDYALESILNHSGYVKTLYRATLPNGITAIVGYPSHDDLKLDFHHGMEMLLAFQSTPYVAEVLGYCDHMSDLHLITKYYKHGSADRLNDVLREMNFLPADEMQVRFHLARDYLSILVFLHDGPMGVRVMCDSNTLEKILSQFLLTDDFCLIANDLDALPEVVEGRGVKCGRRQLFGDFVAPEQLWPHEIPFNNSLMLGYDEKVDIWRVPDVLGFLLGGSANAWRLKLKLFSLFDRCKSLTPDNRPSAQQVLQHFNLKLGVDFLT